MLSLKGNAQISRWREGEGRRCGVTGVLELLPAGEEFFILLDGFSIEGLQQSHGSQATTLLLLRVAEGDAYLLERSGRLLHRILELVEESFVLLYRWQRRPRYEPAR
jgi:hypothetical protein